MSQQRSCDIGGESFTPAREAFWVEGRITIHDRYDDGSPHDTDAHWDICAEHAAPMLGRPTPETRKPLALGIGSQEPHQSGRTHYKVDKTSYDQYMAWLERENGIGENPTIRNTHPDSTTGYMP